MAGVDMIGHLAEVESRTEELVLKAQSEARELVIEARNQGEVRYNECHGQIRASVKERLAAETESMKNGCDEALERYRTSVASSKLDVEAFNSLLDKTLFC